MLGKRSERAPGELPLQINQPSNPMVIGEAKVVKMTVKMDNLSDLHSSHIVSFIFRAFVRVFQIGSSKSFESFSEENQAVADLCRGRGRSQTAT